MCLDRKSVLIDGREGGAVPAIGKVTTVVSPLSSKTLIGMLLDPAVARLDISHGETEDQGPAPRLREQALVGAAPTRPRLTSATRR